MLIAATAALGQVNQNVWVVSSAAAYEVSPTGVLLGTYPSGCYGAASGCTLRTARDQFGNVYVVGISTFFPGVGGSIRKFRSGVAPVAIIGGGFTDMVTDSIGDLWWAQSNYSSQSMGIVSTSVYHGTAPFNGGSTIVTFPLTQTTRLAAHPTSGVWATDGLQVYRLQNATPPTIAITAALAMPGLTALASDSLGRLFAFHSATSQVVRIAQSGGTLAVDWAQPASNVLQIVVDVRNQIYVHTVGASALSTLTKYGPDGTLVSTTNYPVRVTSVDIDTRGGIWGQAFGLNVGVGLFHQDSAGVSSFTVLSPTFNPFDSFATGGDTTGAMFARLGPVNVDSDLDGTLNREECRRGTDPFHATSKPPTVTVAPVLGSSPPAYSLLFNDIDPSHQGLTFVMGCALSSAAGFAAGPFGSMPISPLDPDPLFFASLTYGPPTFVGFAGPIPVGGATSSTLVLPPGTPSGVPIRIAAAVLDPSTLTCLATSAAVTLTTP